MFVGDLGEDEEEEGWFAVVGDWGEDRDAEIFWPEL